MTTPSPLHSTAAKLAMARRWGRDASAVADLERDLAVERIAAHAAKIAAAAPPLTPEQIDRITGILRSAS